LGFLSEFSSVTSGAIEFRRNAGLDIWPSEEVPESDSPQERQAPISFAKVRARRAGGTSRHCKKSSGETSMGIEWVAVGIVLITGAIFFGFPLGVLVGYTWRDRISRERRARFIIEQERRRGERHSGTMSATFR
jgi:hypothetical protein